MIVVEVEVEDTELEVEDVEILDDTDVELVLKEVLLEVLEVE